MFSSDEKKKIASEIEKLLLSLNHTEMPKEKPMFHLRVEGAESWSFADIKPNWTFNDNNKPGINLWNENSRKILNPTEKEAGHVD